MGTGEASVYGKGSATASMSMGNDDTESVISSSTSCMNSSVITGMSSMGVSSMSFEDHSGLIRYPNSMSNLRRLRCYLMACQYHHLDYAKYLGELVPKDVATALSNNPVIFPDVQSVFLAIESLAMNVVPFDQINQFRARCFLSFASHQKKNLSLTQASLNFLHACQNIQLLMAMRPRFR